jgi:hypothetical protein
MPVPENDLAAGNKPPVGIPDVTPSTTPSNNNALFNNLANLGIASAIQAFGGNDPQIEKVGYQGGIPEYTSLRERVPYTNDPTRRPGSGGQRYFTDVGFSRAPEDPSALAAQNLYNIAREDTRAVPPVQSDIGSAISFADLDKLTSSELQEEKSGIANELLRLRGGRDVPVKQNLPRTPTVPMSTLLAGIRGDFQTDLSNLRNIFGRDIAGVRGELGRGIAGVRDEFGRDIAGVRTDLGGDIAGVRTDLGGVRDEFGRDIAGVRTDLGGDIAGVRTDLGGVRDEFGRDITGLRTDLGGLRDEFGGVRDEEYPIIMDSFPTAPTPTAPTPIAPEIDYDQLSPRIIDALKDNIGHYISMDSFPTAPTPTAPTPIAPEIDYDQLPPRIIDALKDNPRDVTYFEHTNIFGEVERVPTSTLWGANPYTLPEGSSRRSLFEETGWVPPQIGTVLYPSDQLWRNEKTGETIEGRTGWTPPSKDWVATRQFLAAGGMAQADPRYFAGV